MKPADPLNRWNTDNTLIEDAMLKKIWEFLRDEKNQKALNLIGGAVAAVVLAVWALWQYNHPKPEPVKSSPSAPIAPVSPSVQLRITSAARKVQNTGQNSTKIKKSMAEAKKRKRSDRAKPRQASSSAVASSELDKVAARTIIFTGRVDSIHKDRYLWIGLQSKSQSDFCPKINLSAELEEGRIKVGQEFSLSITIPKNMIPGAVLLIEVNRKSHEILIEHWKTQPENSIPFSHLKVNATLTKVPTD